MLRNYNETAEHHVELNSACDTKIIPIHTSFSILSRLFTCEATRRAYIVRDSCIIIKRVNNQQGSKMPSAAILLVLMIAMPLTSARSFIGKSGVVGRKEAANLVAAASKQMLEPPTSDGCFRRGPSVRCMGTGPTSLDSALGVFHVEIASRIYTPTPLQLQEIFPNLTVSESHTRLVCDVTRVLFSIRVRLVCHVVVVCDETRQH